MSYSHDDDEHGDWVMQLAYRLRGNGVYVCLDRWSLAMGGNLTHYMERAGDDEYRVITVVSENYSKKCDARDGGAGMEAQMLSARLYNDLAHPEEVVIPIIRNNPHDPPLLPRFLSGQVWQDFRNPANYELEYERLLRKIHRVALDDAPPLGPNPFEGRTAVEARLAITNAAARWHSPAAAGDVEFVYSQNSGNYRIGSGTAEFTLKLQSWPNGIRVYNDPIANVAVINNAQENAELLTDVSRFDTSSRVVHGQIGDALVLHNRHGFWALVYLKKVYARQGERNRELVIEFRYLIQGNRTPDLSGFCFPD